MWENPYNKMKETEREDGRCGRKKIPNEESRIKMKNERKKNTQTIRNTETRTKQRIDHFLQEIYYNARCIQ